MVNIEHVDIIINNTTIIHDAQCTLLPGRITSFIGKSGSGKTTLLKACAGLVDTSRGIITVHDLDIKTLSPHHRARTIGYVFQDFNLFPHLSVIENCIDPLINQGIDRTRAITKTLQKLSDFGLEEYINTFPSQLSGGQQQRVALVRALCLEPTIMLLDEPTASLDPFNADTLADTIQQIAFQGTTIGLSSQDLNFIRKIIDRVYYLEKGHIREYAEHSQDTQDFPLIHAFLNSA